MAEAHPLRSLDRMMPDLSSVAAEKGEAGAEVVLSGHAHGYERFAPQRPDGTLDPERGIREFVVGTGGVGLGSFNTVKPNSQVRNASTHGVLKLTLHAGSYEWKFVPVAGKTFTDSGTKACH